jgi:hypothetical protein
MSGRWSGSVGSGCWCLQVQELENIKDKHIVARNRG